MGNKIYLLGDALTEPRDFDHLLSLVVSEACFQDLVVETVVSMIGVAVRRIL